jgi:hypothetical protein
MWDLWLTKWHWGRLFSEYFCFPLPILIPPTAPHSSTYIIRGWYNRPNSGRLPKRLILAPLQETNKSTVADGSVEIRNEHNQNTNLGCYRYAQLLSYLVQSCITGGRHLWTTPNTYTLLITAYVLLKLIVRNWVLLDKQPVAQLLKLPECWLQSTQKPFTGPYPEKTTKCGFHIEEKFIHANL